MKNIYKILLIVITIPAYGQNFGIRVDPSLGTEPWFTITIKGNQSGNLDFKNLKLNDVHYFPTQLGNTFDLRTADWDVGGNIPIEPNVLFTFHQHLLRDRNCPKGDEMITGYLGNVCLNKSKLVETQEEKEHREKQDFGIKLYKTKKLSRQFGLTLTIFGKKTLVFQDLDLADISLFPVALGKSFSVDLSLGDLKLKGPENYSTGRLTVKPNTLYTIYNVDNEKECKVDDIVKRQPDGSIICITKSALKETKEDKERREEKG